MGARRSHDVALLSTSLTARCISWLCGGFARLVALNGLLIVLSCGAGWVVASGTAVDAALIGRQDVPDQKESSLGDARVVFAANLRVVAALLVGACTFGVLPILVLVWNGYVLGLGLSSLAVSAPATLPFVMMYVPLEFFAIAVASAASMDLSFRIMVSFLSTGPPLLRVPASALVAAVVMLGAAAAIEVVAMRAISRL